jgi:hypothetical protein
MTQSGDDGGMCSYSTQSSHGDALTHAKGKVPRCGHSAACKIRPCCWGVQHPLEASPSPSKTRNQASDVRNRPHKSVHAGALSPWCRRHSGTGSSAVYHHPHSPSLLPPPSRCDSLPSKLHHSFLLPPAVQTLFPSSTGHATLTLRLSSSPPPEAAVSALLHCRQFILFALKEGDKPGGQDVGRL